ncbi:SWI SNF, matrix associated, actin dependent regulator of chromatin, sub b, member 1 [Chytridiales sp. JEL 0842]|nr:SWI SNF, matrix associated, actin dependent regulator of chromatin, sub b, member 1 [Chytridiales sp. JEL 0842]
MSRYSTRSAHRDTSPPLSSSRDAFQGYEDDEDWLDGGEEGKKKRGLGLDYKYVTDRRRKPTAHVYASKEVMEAAALAKEQLVVVKLDLEVEGIKLVDSFTWNLNESLITPEKFAEIMVADMDTPIASQFVPLISKCIREQCQAWKDSGDVEPDNFNNNTTTPTRLTATENDESISTLNTPTTTDVSAPEEEVGSIASIPTSDSANSLSAHFNFDEASSDEQRILIKLDLQVGTLLLKDQFEWPLHASSESISPEQFAAVLAAEVGVGGEFVPLIAHNIREQVHKARLDDRVGDIEFLPLLEGDLLLRSENEVVNYTPEVKELSEDDVEKILKERERTSRRVRRSQRASTSRMSHSPSKIPYSQFIPRLEDTNNVSYTPPTHVPLAIPTNQTPEPVHHLPPISHLTPDQYPDQYPQQDPHTPSFSNPQHHPQFPLMFPQLFPNAFMPMFIPGLPMMPPPPQPNQPLQRMNPYFMFPNGQLPSPVSPLTPMHSSNDMEKDIQLLAAAGHHPYSQGGQYGHPNNGYGGAPNENLESYPSPPLADVNSLPENTADKWALLAQSINMIEQSASLLNPNLSLTPNLNINHHHHHHHHHQDGHEHLQIPGRQDMGIHHLLPSAVTPGESKKRPSSGSAPPAKRTFTPTKKGGVPNNIKTSSTDPSILPYQLELMKQGCPPVQKEDGHKGAMTTEDILARKHRGFGASAKVFNFDGSKDVGEFRKNWKCSWCLMSGKFTPTLRRGPLGTRTVCNACGIWYAKYQNMPEDRYREFADAVDV